MDNKTRRTRFETRIMLEREFLAKVNTVFGSAHPLTGMTVDAIRRWGTELRRVAPSPIILDLEKLLLEASARADLMADDSKEVFEPARRELDSLVEVRVLLDQKLEWVLEQRAQPKLHSDHLKLSSGRTTLR